MRRQVLILAVILLALTSTVVVGAPPPSGTTPVSTVLDVTSYINANRILMFVTNQGVLARDLSGVFGYDAGFFYPYTSHEDIISGVNDDCVIYACGLWIGGVDAVTGDTLLAIAEYNSEYTPGPVISGSFAPDAYDNPAYRVYKLYSDSLADNPNADFLEWPISQGASVRADGSPLLIGDQTAWTVFNDLDPNQHWNNCGYTNPLGLEIQQTVAAFGAGPFEEVLFLKYKILNKGGKSLDEVVLSMWCDPDLGYHADDLVGCDSIRSTGYVYNADNDDDGHYGSTPPAVGYTLLQGPMVHTGDPADTARMWGEVYAEFENLPMTSFVKYINGTDPGNYQETYRYMNGLLRNGDPYYYDGQPLAFQHSGNPLMGTGDLDSDPADRRFMVNTGPIHLSPGDSTEIVLSIVVAREFDRLASVSLMLDRVVLVRGFDAWPNDPDTLINVVKWPAARGGNDHWYGVIPLELYWDEALGLAGTLDLDGKVGYLATVTSAAENRFIHDYVIDGLKNPCIFDEYWLGGHDVDGQWTWITDEPWEFTNWGPGEPDNIGLETALSMWSPSGTDPGSVAGMWATAEPDDSNHDLHRFWSVVEFSFPALAVDVDIVPGACPNNMAVAPFYQVVDDEDGPLVAKSSKPVVPSFSTFTVAILGSDEIDVTMIDPSSVKWERLSPLSWSFDDVSTPNASSTEPCGCNDDGPDGHVDLVMEFRRFFAILAPPEVRIGDGLTVNLTGELFDGQPILGSDCIVLKGKSWTETAFDPVSSQPTLLGNNPNPFNPSTEIVYSLPASSDVKLEVFNVLGQKVTTLVDGRMDAGVHTVSWDSRGSDGGSLASGIYLYRIQIGAFVEARKMMLVK